MTSDEKSSSPDLRHIKAMVRLLIEHHFGEKPRRLIYKSSGLTNFVFLVEHAKGEFLIRLNPSATKITSFMKEQWAISKAREVGVPIPEVLEVGNEVVPYPYMISRRVRGIEASDHPERLQIIREMGHYASIINSIQTLGFGETFDWSNNQLSRNKTWLEFLNTELNLSERLAILEKYSIVSQIQLKRLRIALKSIGKKDLKPTLNHGDLRLKNVIVDDKGKIVAIIDWEHCLSSLAPQWELSIALHDLSIDEKHEFLQGYKLSPKEMLRIAPLVKAINILNYAPKIGQLEKRRDKDEIDQFRMRLKAALDLYSL